MARLSGLGAILGLASLLVPLPATAGPADTIGEATRVENLVTASYARDTRSLLEGDRVRQNERITVGLDARSELQFEDETRIALGPGTELVLDRFVYDPDKASGNIMMDMVKGTMRWVTGVAKKPTYTIRVPNASITVRGTIFDLYVTEKGETWLLLHEGAVQVCTARGVCRAHRESCKLVRISEGGDIAGPTRWSGIPGARDNMFHRAFPFVVLPPAIDPEPVCKRDDITGGRDASAPPRNDPPSAPPVRKASVERSYEPTNAADVAPPRPVKRITKSKDDERYEKPRYELPKRKKVVVVDPKPRIKYPRRERKYDDDDDRPKKPRYKDYGEQRHKKEVKKAVGRAILGAAVLGAAIAIGRHRGGGGYGY